MHTPLKEADLLALISRQWRIDFACLRPDRPLAGSPERTAWRSVAETSDHRLFVLEKIPSTIYNRKRRIAGALQHLFAHGLRQILPYLPDADGDPIPLIDHGLWQLQPYVSGVDLDRPAYAMDAWRGGLVADFLIRLRDICFRYPLSSDTSPFSIAAYGRNLFKTLTIRNPEIAERYRPFMDHLENHFFPTADPLPMGFCHGDVHPLNIIWGKEDIRAIIDWEFCGIKTEIYDLANLLGCLGMEDPQSLTGPFAQVLISRLRRSDIFGDESWKALPDLILAIRFAWLNEWLRKKDQPMIQLEAEYMALLLNHRPVLTDQWERWE